MYAEDEARLLRDAAVDDRALAAMVADRVAGRPLEQILGWAEFCGHRILVDPGVFVPRGRTELLVRLATALMRPDTTVVDLCCGSGAVAVAIEKAAAATGSEIEVHAADVDPVAVRCARRNLVTGTAHLGDLYDALPPHLAGRVDLIVANAPYVPTAAIATMPPEARLHEPRVALDGGPDGVDVHRRVAAEARHWLAADGHLLVETGDRQADATATACRTAGLTTRIARDRELDATVVVATLRDDRG